MDEEIKKIINQIEDRLALHEAIKEPISKDLDKAIKLSVAYEELLKENQQLKEQLEEYQMQNFNLREDKIIKKMSFPNEEIKDKSLLELYNMPSYEDLKKENQQLKDIINKAKEYNKQIIKDTKEFYRPTCDRIYSGDCLIDLAEENIKILENKGSDK